MASAEELYLVLFLVQWIVIDSRIFTCIPIEDEFPIVQTTNFAFLLQDQNVPYANKSISSARNAYFDNAKVSFFDDSFFTFSVGICKTRSSVTRVIRHATTSYLNCSADRLDRLSRAVNDRVLVALAHDLDPLAWPIVRLLCSRSYASCAVLRCVCEWPRLRLVVASTPLLRVLAWSRIWAANERQISAVDSFDTSRKCSPWQWPPAPFCSAPAFPRVTAARVWVHLLHVHHR